MKWIDKERAKREMENKNLIEMIEAIRDQARVIDLSYTMELNMPFWPTQPKYESTVVESYESGGASFHCAVRISEHTGTHIDAPKHFIPGGCPVDELDPRTVMGRGVTIHAENVEPCGLLSLDQIREFEAENGQIRAGDIVMFRFGWEDKYAAGSGGKGFLEDWPGLSGEAAQYLAEKNVAAVGCDTLALDAFGVNQYVCHEILLGKGIPIMENLCNLSELPPFCGVIGLQNKFKGGSGSPIRLVAFVQ